MRLKSKRNYTNLLVWTDKKIIPMCMFEWTLWGTILEKINEKKTSILSLNEIFEAFTFKRKERFMIISGLIKKKVIKRKRINIDFYEYSCLQDTGCPRIYPSLTKKERHSLIKEFS